MKLQKEGVDSSLFYMGGNMTITFDRIAEWQTHFRILDHSKSELITWGFTHDELNELIFILGNMLYFMHMTNREEIYDINDME